MAWFVATLLVAAAAIALGFSLGWHNATRRSQQKIESKPAVAEKDERTTHRAAALDSVEEAVLVADCEGRIRDCNSSALTLFDRHRDEVEAQYTTMLRRFDGQDQAEPHRLASEHSVWVGEGWVKQPDGGMKLCQVRVMAIRDERARIVAFAESYQPVVHDQNVEQEVRNLLNVIQSALQDSDERQTIEVVSAVPGWVELIVPCTREAAERIAPVVERLGAGIPEDVLESVAFAFRELVMNAVEWGGGLDPSRKVRITCVRTDRMLMYRIADPGPGFTFDNLDHAAIAHDNPIDHLMVRDAKGLRPGGFGVLTVRASVDELVYNQKQNEVIFIKYLS